MLIIADENMPIVAKKELEKYGLVIWFLTKNIVYPSISGHPDIFFTQIGNKIIIAPNTPEFFIEKLIKFKIDFCLGNSFLKPKYPYTCHYNILIDNNIAVHNFSYTDNNVLKNLIDQRKIHVNQGYSKCNCISLNSLAYICSDISIYNKMKNISDNVLYINPKGIILPGFKNGFIGGTMGIVNNNLFVTGSIKKHSQYKEIKKFIESLNINLIELHNNQLFDVGSIMFFKKN